MAGTSVITLAPDDVVMKYREPFLTKGLNRKLAVNTPAGVYKGFRLASSVTPLNVVIEPDPISNTSSAVYETGGGESLTVTKVGSFLVDLTPFAGQTVAVALFASYEIGLDTFAEIRVYEVAPTDELTGSPEEGELVVLGTVIVPGAVIQIPAADVTMSRRVSAWQRRAPESVTWAPLIRNPSFEWGDTAVSPAPKFASAFWEITNELPNGHWDVSAGNPNVGAKHVELTWTGPGDIDCTLFQHPNVPVKPGQLLRAQLFKQLLQIPVTGAVFVWAKFQDSTGGDVLPATVFTTQIVDSLLSTTVDLSYVKVEVMIEVPANATHLTEVGVFVNDATFPLVAPALRIDDVQFWLETIDPESPFVFEDEQGAKVASSLVLRDGAGNVTSREAALSFDRNTPVNEGSILVARRDGQTGPTDLPPALSLRGRLIRLGAGLNDTAAKADVPRIATPIAVSGVSDYTLLWEITSATPTTAGARVYATHAGNGGIVFVSNASYDSTAGVWSKDIVGDRATKFAIVGGALITDGVPDTLATPWTDLAWTDSSPFVSQRRTLSGADSRTLLWQSNTALPFPTTLNAHVRIYHSGTVGDQLEITVNAKWDFNTLLWNHDNPGIQATRFAMAGILIDFSVQQRFTVGAWNDASWDTNPITMSSFLRVFNMDDMSISILNNSGFSNPSGFDAQLNKLTALNIPKMWCSLLTNGGGGYTLFDGFNVSPTVLLSGSFSTMFFSEPMDNAFFAVSITAMDTVGGANSFCQVVGRGPTGFNFRLRDGHLGTNRPLTTTACEMMFIVFGRQTHP